MRTFYVWFVHTPIDNLKTIVQNKHAVTSHPHRRTSGSRGSDKTIHCQTILWKVPRRNTTLAAQWYFCRSIVQPELLSRTVWVTFRWIIAFCCHIRSQATSEPHGMRPKNVYTMVLSISKRSPASTCSGYAMRWRDLALTSRCSEILSLELGPVTSTANGRPPMRCVR